jgi:hypothetical protein
MEDKICKNCKFYDPNEGRDFGYCQNKIVIQEAKRGFSGIISSTLRAENFIGCEHFENKEVK